MQRRSYPDGQKGFTLIEVIVSLAVFTIGILACYAMQLNSTVSSGRANSVQTSSTWATYIAEEFLALEYADPLLQNSAGDALNGLTDIDDTNRAGDTPDGVRYITRSGSVCSAPSSADLYAVFWNVAENRPLAGLKQVRITVVKNGGLNAGIHYSHDYYKLRNNF
ncbi:MAG: prepilin-type N-terminal cleavage/methylation domain-containing protein [Desulfobulbaceae bacterium]|nr:MAG: prepilin-type N-terminal cleavage/methylation domain-containing protein [Desulfobulbaceae bacterium]